MAGVSKSKAEIAHLGVEFAWWAWYDLDSEMPWPYTTNRLFENFELRDK
jgi:hypothetical protein